MTHSETTLGPPLEVAEPAITDAFGKEYYQIHLPQFEGPFDLLLFFIEKDELDVYDIPISKITDDFLSYLHTLERRQIEIASEFILMAARLMKIKAAMLLPRPKLDDKGEVLDPRTELVDRLLEYQKYKQGREILEELEELQVDRLTRGKFEQLHIRSLKTEPEEELHGLTLFGLLKAYQRVLDKHAARSRAPKHVIEKYPYTVEEVKIQITELVAREEKLDFAELAARRPEKIYLIFSFLCILELVQQRKLRVVIGDRFNNFWLMPAPEAPEPAPETDAPDSDEAED